MLYFDFIRIRLKEMVIYPKAFISGFMAQAFSHLVNIFLLYIVISRFDTINGWTSFEILFIYALNLFTYGIAGFFMFNPCTRLSEMVRTGEFDDVLTKPLNPLFYLISREFNVGYISHCTLSFVVLVICLVRLNIQFTLFSFGLFILFILGAVLIQAAAFLFVFVPSFWLIKNDALPRVFLWNLTDFIRYPISIYNRPIQILLTFIVPYAFISFYPSQYFLNKTDFLMFGSYIQYLSPLVGAVMFILGYMFWKYAINHYQSTGS